MSQKHSSTQQTKSGEQAQASTEFCLAVVSKDTYDSFPLYWLAVPEHHKEDVDKIKQALQEILTDPLQEELLIAKPSERTAWMETWNGRGYRWWAERQFLPGVTDNLAHTVEEALELKGFAGIKVASGAGYLYRDRTMPAPQTVNRTLSFPMIYSDSDSVEKLARYSVYHPLTDSFKVHDLSSLECLDELLLFPAVKFPQAVAAQPINLDLSDEGLQKLSDQRLLALNLSEMRAIRAHFKIKQVQKDRDYYDLPAAPTDVELEILAQTWSEHCKHKIFNATIWQYDFTNEGRTKTIINSLYKTFIQAPTKQLMSERKDLLSVFEDNSGVVKWNDDWAICFKVETHNSPSALEPYGGALTGILGVNRDILGTGLGAKPLFNTDVFCFAYPSSELPARPKLLPPKSIIDGVRKGVEDGGNKSGIPTVNGSIVFHAGYRAKPLVFCGTGGILPLVVHGQSGFGKHTKVGDSIVMVGGRVGKDGIHGATFSSESLHEGSPVSAVQIGDPFTQKRVLDFVLEARDAGLITGITDNGAGGLSSSVGEMALFTGGATIELNRVPTKYPGLADWEIVVSESQERMTLSTRKFDQLQKLALKHHVEATEIGRFTESGYFEVTRAGKPVAYLELEFLHQGVPTLELEAEWRPSQITMTTGSMPADLNRTMLKLLAHPNICSRDQVIRQYDHEVQGMSVIKPLMGNRQQAPCDAAVICPIYGDNKGLAISNGLAPRLSEHDAHLMAVCSVDEAVRNIVCVGADPSSISLLDNFCWPDPVMSPKNPHAKSILAQLVRACQGLKEAVLAFKAPLISGKDSMKNDFDDGTLRLSVPPTLLISAIAPVPDVSKCVTSEFKRTGDLIYLVVAGKPGLAGSHLEEICGWQSALTPQLELAKAAQLYRKVHAAMQLGLVNSAHDLSDGGLGITLAECVIGSNLGCSIKLDDLITYLSRDSANLPYSPGRILSRLDAVIFAEGPGRLLLTVDPASKQEWEEVMQGCDIIEMGNVSQRQRLTIMNKQAFVVDLAIGELERAWRTPLPFD